MTRITRWAAPALVVVLMAMALPALSQSSDNKATGKERGVKEKVALIKQGQLDLMSATQIAVKHVSGDAVDATSMIRTDKATSGSDGAKGADSPTGQRLVYSITCFAKEKVQVVQVDGLTRKVIDDERSASRP